MSTNVRLKMLTNRDRFYKDAIKGEIAYEIDSRRKLKISHIFAIIYLENERRSG